MKDGFLEFLKECTCSYTTVRKVKKELVDCGYKPLNLNEKWNIVPGEKYVVPIYETGIVAFGAGKNYDGNGQIRIAAAHTDQPSLVIKPNPFIMCGKYMKADVECYGGAILNTWLDRPLGIAGCVVCKGDDVFTPRVIVIDSVKPVMVIPNLAIHFNRDVNKGVELNRQKDMMPLAAVVSEKFNKDGFIYSYLSELSGADKEDIIDYQLYLYNYESGIRTGINDEILMAPRIDNLASVYAITEAIKENVNENIFFAAAFFDNEEVGSKTKQGAASDVLHSILSRVFYSMSYSESDFNCRINDGFFLSVDGAHALHPNHMDKYDPANTVYLNDGIIIKKAASQSYSTDAVAAAVVKQLCCDGGIRYKDFVNKSDMPGGSTLGAIASTKLPMRMADIGIPMLAMHSAMETTGSEDVEELIKLLKLYFSK